LGELLGELQEAAVESIVLGRQELGGLAQQLEVGFGGQVDHASVGLQRYVLDVNNIS
jgi:hypothetical protein